MMKTDYQNMRGGRVILRALQAPEVKSDTSNSCQIGLCKLMHGFII